MSKKGFDCCGDEQSGEQACECLPQALEDQVTPNGARLLAVDKERTYRTGDGKLWLSREDYKALVSGAGHGGGSNHLVYSHGPSPAA